MGEIVYFVVPSGGTWCVASRGFGWRFSNRKSALHFALHTAQDFARSTGRTTVVRLQRLDGTLRQLLAFAGITRLPTSLSGWPWKEVVRHR
jgi:hypothetical protein